MLTDAPVGYVQYSMHVCDMMLMFKITESVAVAIM
jgi:hypothetical protein